VGLSCPSKPAADLVAAVWLRLPPRRFHDLAVFRGPASPTPKCRKLPWAWIPSRVRLTTLAGDHTPRQPSWDSAPLQRRELRGPLFPGFQARFVPSSAFLTLLTACSLCHLPVSRTGATHGVHPSELFPSAEPHAFRRRYPLAVSDIALYCSEDQKATMPCSSRAFLPAEIRTHPGRSPAEPILSWVSCASPELDSHAVGSASRPFPSCAFRRRSRGNGSAALQGLAERARLPGPKTRHTLLRFTTGICPRALPTTVASPMRIAPTKNR
jgi:hypothetical protein